MIERSRQFGWLERAAVAVTVLALLGAGVESTHFRPPPDATQYLNRVRYAVNGIPRNLGPWVGVDGSIEVEAIQLLHPNAMISREYTRSSGESSDRVGFMFLACSDARDTVGHYPPICYPAQGWRLEMTEPKTWPIGPNGRTVIHGTEYTFVQSLFDASGSEVVENFFILPKLGTVPDRDQVIAAASDLQRRYYGVSQVQIIFNSRSDAEERDRAVKELMTPLEGVFHTIQDVKAGDAK